MDREGNLSRKEQGGLGAEVFAVPRAVRHFHERSEEGQSYTTFTDWQAVAERIRHDGCGPAQALAKAVITLAQEIHDGSSRVTIR